MKRPDRNNTNPRYWHEVLRGHGLGATLRPLPKKKIGKATRPKRNHG